MLTGQLYKPDQWQIMYRLKNHSGWLSGNRHCLAAAMVLPRLVSAFIKKVFDQFYIPHYLSAIGFSKTKAKLFLLRQKTHWNGKMQVLGAYKTNGLFL